MISILRSHVQRTNTLALISCSTLVILANCSQATSVPPVSYKGSLSPTSIQISLIIPAAAKFSSSASRRLRYLSSNTSSLVITDTPDGASALPPSTVNVSNCAVMTSGRSCQLSVPAIAGGNTLSISAFDGVNGGGNLISTGSARTTVVPATANAVSLTLGGVINSIVLDVDATAPFTGTPSTINLYVTAKDADGSTIIGPFSQSVSLTNSDTSGVTTLAQSTLAASVASIPIQYTGATLSATISASANGLPASSVTSIQIQSRPAGQYLYVGINPGNGIGPGLIEEFPLSANGNVSPSWTITDPIWAAYPQAIAGDAKHNLYVFNNGYSSRGAELAVFAPGVSGSNARSTRTLNSDNSYPWTFPNGLAADSIGGVYVSTGGSNNFGNTVQGSVAYFAAAKFSSSQLSVAVSPTLRLSDSLTNGGHVANLVTDVLGRVIVLYNGNFAYTTFPSQSSGPVAPLSCLCIGSIAYSSAIYYLNGELFAVDAGNNLHLSGRYSDASGSHNAILTFPAVATNSTLPTAILSGSSTHLDDAIVFAMAIANDGRVFVEEQIQTTSPETYQILVFPPGASGNTAPTQIIAGPNTNFKNAVTIAVF